MTTPDDDSTPRTNKRKTEEYSDANITTFRLDRIDQQNDDQSRKLDKIDRLLTRHIERQENHEARLTAVEKGVFKVLWTVLIGCAGALGSLIVGLLPHGDKVPK